MTQLYLVNFLFNFVFQAIDETFGLSPGFYWQTVETQECVCKKRETTHKLHTEVSMLSFKSVLCSTSRSFLVVFFVLRSRKPQEKL